MPGISEVAGSLEALSFSDLSNVAWQDEALLAVVRSDSSGVKPRFFACEVLLRRDLQKYLAMIGSATVAAMYVSAVREQITSDLNPWAFLGLAELGPLGRHLVACDESAVRALLPLLDFKQTAGIYSGSEESKEGNADQPRICDFAAFFIARIKGWPFSFHRESWAGRDEEMERIKKRLQRDEKNDR